jgi:hypothetical protein
MSPRKSGVVSFPSLPHCTYISAVHRNILYVSGSEAGHIEVPWCTRTAYLARGTAILTVMQRELKPPFKFDVADLVRRLRKLPISVDGISITLPFIEVSVKADKTERKVAREVVIRLADRRVLTSFECCDNCIDQALTSLQQIRQIIVDKQVELSDKTDTALYVLLDSIRDSIRQFLTFEQRLSKGDTADPRHKGSFHRPAQSRELYFSGLEMLRAHIHRTLLQVAKIADIDEIPGVAGHMRYDEQWQLEAYRKPKALPE